MNGPRGNGLPPLPTGKKAEGIDLTGTLFPWENGQPVFLQMPNSPYRYLACFSTPEKLRETLDQANVTYESIKQVQDGTEFLTSFDGHSSVKVILDPYYLPDGKVRFLQILGEDA